MPHISIIIVNYNTKKLLQHCIESLYSSIRSYSFEILVVDNNSPDGSADMVAGHFPGVILVRNSDNKGFAAANNQALHMAKGKLLLLLNPDVLVKGHAIDEMVGFIENIHPQQAGIVTCKLLNADGSFQPSVNPFYSFWNSVFNNRLFRMVKENPVQHLPVGTAYQSIDWAHGAVMLFTRPFFDKIGYLDEQFYIYGEEIDYFKRAKKEGYENFYLPETEIIHYGGASSRQNKINMFIQNYRSFFQYLRKHHGYAEYFAYRLRSIFYALVWFVYFQLSAFFKKNEYAQLYRRLLYWNITWGK